MRVNHLRRPLTIEAKFCLATKKEVRLAEAELGGLSKNLVVTHEWLISAERLSGKRTTHESRVLKGMPNDFGLFVRTLTARPEICERSHTILQAALEPSCCNRGVRKREFQ